MRDPKEIKKNIKVNYNGIREILTPFEFDRRLRLGLLPVIVTNGIYKEVN